MKKQIIALSVIAFSADAVAQQTANYLPKFSTPPTIVDSKIFDNGFVGIGLTTPARALHVYTSQVNGGMRITQWASGFSALELDNITSGGHKYALVSTGYNNGEGVGHFGIYDYNAASYRFFITSAGNLSIGSITTPLAKLQVGGNALFSTGTYDGISAPYIKASTVFSTQTTPDYTWWNNDQTGMFHPTNNVIGFTTGGVERMRINDIGNVAIGTINPGTFKLAVEGKIAAREVLVTNVSPFPDYVFEKEYKLSSLEETEKFIIENKHLEGIPSACEVEENNGINVGEMQLLQMKKIEEIYLHLIRLNKTIEMLAQENKQLKAQLDGGKK